MFVYSVKANKKTLIGAAIIVVAFIIIAFLISGRTSTVNAVLDADVKLESNAERVAFLKKFGYDVINEPRETKEIIIPEDFNSTYTQYNELQKKQGFDLSKYKGKVAKSYSYAVKNYPGIEDSEQIIRANMIICGGRLIAGDICSVERNGFMHTFNKSDKI